MWDFAFSMMNHDVFMFSEGGSPFKSYFYTK